VHSLLRAIDANTNRAREALRVMEDVARFGLDDEALCGSLKAIRHDLAGALGNLPIDPIIARDTPKDVGRDIKTEAEGHRDGARGVAIAAGKRLTEALRSIEEHAKAIGEPMVAGRIEQVRYRSYEAERALTFALGSSRRRQWRLCVIVTERLCIRPWQDVARESLEAGAECMQLREKDLDDGEFLARASLLRAITREHGAALIINDRPDIAVLAGADGVHVGQTDLPIAEARRVVGLERLIGFSATTIDQARQALRDGADYLGLGPMFATITKAAPGGRADGSLAGPALIREFTSLKTEPRPHLAIGGITPANVSELVVAGCKGVAVCAGVCGSPDPGDVCRAMLEALRRVEAATTVAQHT
jgi:thiamine-phosphate pyrophosphorylase